jgi:hypothetical protein
MSEASHWQQIRIILDEGLEHEGAERATGAPPNSSCDDKSAAVVLVLNSPATD